MLIDTPGILLKRLPSKEFDERILFFTKDFGKIYLQSFGSRSARSTRNKLLAGYDWLKISLDTDKKQLLELRVLKKNDSLRDLDLFNRFTFILSIIYKMLPYEMENLQIFKLLYIFSRRDIITIDDKIFTVFFIFSLLRILGSFPYFTECSICHKKCSTEYVYNFEKNTYIGTGCSANNDHELFWTDLQFLNGFYHQFQLNFNWYKIMMNYISGDVKTLHKNIFTFTPEVNITNVYLFSKQILQTF